jgi:hypothetical protein
MIMPFSAHGCPMVVGAYLIPVQGPTQAFAPADVSDKLSNKFN